MVDGLRVDTDGLRSGVATSHGLAFALVGEAPGGSVGSQPSHGGVSAMLAAVQSVRGRQAGRIAQQASGIRTGAGRYDDTDERFAAHVTQVM